MRPTLGAWFGVSSSALDVIFPNLRNFGTRKPRVV